MVKATKIGILNSEMSASVYQTTGTILVYKNSLEYYL